MILLVILGPCLFNLSNSSIQSANLENKSKNNENYEQVELNDEQLTYIYIGLERKKMIIMCQMAFFVFYQGKILLLEVY